MATVGFVCGLLISAVLLGLSESFFGMVHALGLCVDPVAICILPLFCRLLLSPQFGSLYVLQKSIQPPVHSGTPIALGSVVISKPPFRIPSASVLRMAFLNLCHQALVFCL